MLYVAKFLNRKPGSCLDVVSRPKRPLPTHLLQSAPTTRPCPSHTQTYHSIPADPIPAPTPTPFPVELMSVTATPAPSRSITPFLKPNHNPFNTPIQSPGTTEHTQTD